MTTTLCINQFIRPNIYVAIPGEGDCRTCTCDEQNKECRGYRPINLVEFETE